MKRKVLYLLCILLVLSNIVFSYGSEKHWVYDELAEFKQLALNYNNMITREEWESVKHSVFDETKLDQPIATYNWAILVKMILDPDHGTSGQMMDQYLYNLAKGNVMKREDAVGGLVKLLTKDYVKGSVTWEEVKPAEALLDLKEISEMQTTLVQIAYIEGILDSKTITHFKPKQDLTNAEAISILNKVIKKYKNQGIKADRNANDHWSYHHIKSFANNIDVTDQHSKIINTMVQSYDNLNTPISIDHWNTLLLDTLNLDVNDKMARDYTFGLSENGSIRRGEAVAGIIKLLHIKEYIKGRDASQEEQIITSKALRDYDTAFDKSKLSIAYVEGIINGYEDGTFRPNQFLKKGEAFALLNTITHKYLININ